MFRKMRLSAVAALICAVLSAVPVWAGVPEIVVDGVVVQEKSYHLLILEAAARAQTWFEEWTAAGGHWEYHNDGTCMHTFQEAYETGLTGTNCAHGVCLVIRESGIVPESMPDFFGWEDGTIKWKDDAAEPMIRAVADIYEYRGSATVGELIAQGVIWPGDVVTYTGFTHTNLYAGNGYWYDFGHANCVRDGDGAWFSGFVSRHDWDGSRVGCVIHWRDDANAISIESADEPPIIIDGIAMDDDPAEEGDGGIVIETVEYYGRSLLLTGYVSVPASESEAQGGKENPFPDTMLCFSLKT